MRIVAAVGAVLLTALLAGSVRAQSLPQLAFADDEPLVISIDSGEKTASATVVLVNGGQDVDELSFSAVSVDADAAAVKVEASGNRAIFAGGAAPITLSFSSAEAIGDFNGHVVATSGTVAAERDLKINEKDTVPLSVNIIIFGSFLIGAAFAVVRALTLRPRLSYLLSAPGWDFSKSWASTFTVVGAVLGTVLASLVLPATPERFSKATLAGMNLIFAAAILLAPFLFAITESPQDVDDSDGKTRKRGQGTVAGYLMACGLTLTGVIGQLITVFFLLDEIESNNALPDEALQFLFLFLFAAAVLVLVYAWRTIGWTAANATAPQLPPSGATPDDEEPRGERPRVAEVREPAFSPPLL